MGSICTRTINAKNQSLIKNAHIGQPTENTYDTSYKIIILGESGVGKTSFCNRTFLNKFDHDSTPTVGLEFRQKLVTDNGINAKLCIWDTAGQDRYRAITSAFYRSADAVLLMYDCTNKESFDRLKIWLNELDRFLHRNLDIIVLANKSDKNENKEISTELGKKFSEEINAEFFEISVMKNINCDNVITLLSNKLTKKSKKCLETN